MPFVCEVPEQEAHASDCRCCGPLAPVLWGIYGGLRATGCTDVVRMMKDDGVENDPDARPEEDPTLTEELLLAAILGAAVFAVTSKALDRFWRAISREFTAEAVAKALDRAIQSTSSPLTRRQQDEVSRLIERAMTNGSLDGSRDDTPAPESRVSNRPERQDAPSERGRLGARQIGLGTALENDRNSVLAWTNLRRVIDNDTSRYFEEVVAPAIRRNLSPLLDEARDAAGRGEDFAPDFSEVRGLIDAQVQQTSRWRVVANASVSRAYHYGFLRTAEISGITSYTWVTVGDERVCAICSALGGMTFPVRSAMDLMDAVAESNDPQTVRNVMPWPRNVEELRARAVMIPPAHARCRCTIRVRRTSVRVAL